MLNQQLKGMVAYSDGLPFNGALRIRRTDGNALQEMFREVPIVNGVIPDYVRLYPGIYEVQWLPSSPDGFLPSEGWQIPEVNELNINEIRERFSVPDLLAQKDAIIKSLQDEIARIKKAPEDLGNQKTSLTVEEVIEEKIEEVTGVRKKEKKNIAKTTSEKANE